MGIQEDSLKGRILFLKWTIPFVLVILVFLQQGANILWTARYNSAVLNISVALLFSLLGSAFIFWNFERIYDWSEKREQARKQNLVKEHKLAQIVNSTLDAIFST